MKVPTPLAIIILAFSTIALSDENLLEIQRMVCKSYVHQDVAHSVPFLF